MTTTVWCIIALTVLLALVNWGAVAADRRRLEHVTRPATTAALAAAAAVLTPTSRAQWALFLVAIGLSLVRDMLLIRPQRWWTPAVAVGMAVHASYAAGFQQVGWSWLWAAAGIVVVLVAALSYGARLVSGVRETDPKLTALVIAYVGVLSFMVVAAASTGQPTAVAGAFLFYLADALAGWNRYRSPTAYARQAVTASYHLAQLLLLLSLL